MRTPDPSPAFGAGERIVVLARVPRDPDYPAQALPQDAGTVTFNGPWIRDYRPVTVRLDRTNRDVTVFETQLAPEPDTP